MGIRVNRGYVGFHCERIGRDRIIIHGIDFGYFKLELEAILESNLVILYEIVLARGTLYVNDRIDKNKGFL